MRRRDFITGLGAAAGWPLVARAQRRPPPVIGYVNPGIESTDDYVSAAFRRGLGEQGYVEGQNVEILYRHAEGQNSRLPALVEDLVRRNVNVIASVGAGILFVRAAKAASASIPIVFGTANDPVTLGLVPSLNRPGGNVTGVFFLTGALVPKRLELLHEIVPAIKSIAFLIDPTGGASGQIVEAEAAARLLGVDLTVFYANTAAEIADAFASFPSQGIRALLPSSNAFFSNQRHQFTELAARYAVPAIYPYREYVEAGGLMSYGPSITDAARLEGTYVGRILKGEKPADLPVQQSTRIEMVLNLKTARALGIEVPTPTLLRATEVIE